MEANSPHPQHRSPRSAPRSLARPRDGFALEIVLLMLVMFSVIVLAGLSAVTTISRTSQADYGGARASYAAEGAADDIMSQLDAAMQDGIIDGQDIAGIQTPQVQGYKVSQRTNTAGVPISRTITSGPFAGLYSLNQPIDIEVTARDSSDNRATAVLSVNAQTIPLFQFGVFYEDDLEILPGAPMTFVGWVHTNGNLYLSSNSATFQSNLTTPDSVFWQRKDANQRLNGVRINNAAGTPVLLDFDSRSHAGAAFKTRSQQRFSGRLMSNAHGVRPLKLPLPAGMPPITLVEPRSATDNAMVQDVKMAWKADWYITVNAMAFEQPTPALQAAALCNTMVHQRSGGLQVPSLADCQAIFVPRPNAFYEGREDSRPDGAVVRPDLIEVNMQALRTWSNAAPAQRAPRIIYINVVNMSAASSTRDFVALRLRHGAILPDPAVAGTNGGLTIATLRPVYVLGHYNRRANWRPAAIMGDAITFLSEPPNPDMSNAAPTLSAQRCSNAPGWCDVMQQSAVRRTARETEVNAALLMGHSATPNDWMRVGSAQQYGGGLENFPRFLENWGGVTHRYEGSLVSLYRSQYAIGFWGNTVNGEYYSAPTRDWKFDVNFRFPDRLPPGTPSVGTVLQTAFRPLY